MAVVDHSDDQSRREEERDRGGQRAMPHARSHALPSASRDQPQQAFFEAHQANRYVERQPSQRQIKYEAQASRDERYRQQRNDEKDQSEPEPREIASKVRWR